MYIFKQKYEIFFGSFHIELYESVSNLTDHKTCFKNDEPKE